MRTPFQPQHAKALTVLLLSIRPDWNQGYTFDALCKMRAIDDDLERICRVAVRGALSPKIRKPDVLAMQGEHWKAQADTTGGDPRRATRCARCGDWLTTGRHAEPDDCRPKSTAVSEHAAAVKAEIRKGKAPDRQASKPTTTEPKENLL